MSLELKILEQITDCISVVLHFEHGIENDKNVGISIYQDNTLPDDADFIEINKEQGMQIIEFLKNYFKL